MKFYAELVNGTYQIFTFADGRPMVCNFQRSHHDHKWKRELKRLKHQFETKVDEHLTKIYSDNELQGRTAEQATASGYANTGKPYPGRQHPLSTIECDWNDARVQAVMFVYTEKQKQPVSVAPQQTVIIQMQIPAQIPQANQPAQSQAQVQVNQPVNQSVNQPAQVQVNQPVNQSAQLQEPVVQLQEPVQEPVVVHQPIQATGPTLQQVSGQTQGQLQQTVVVQQPVQNVSGNTQSTQNVSENTQGSSQIAGVNVSTNLNQRMLSLTNVAFEGLNGSVVDSANTAQGSMLTAYTASATSTAAANSNQQQAATLSATETAPESDYEIIESNGTSASI